MATPNTPMLLTKNSQQAIVEFHKSCYQLLRSQWNLREQMRQIDLAYIREQDMTTEHRRAKLANRYGDSSRIQNVTVPVVMPQVESAVTYQASVFLTGSPLFSVVTSPEYINEALQLETVIDDQAIRGGWVRELLLFFRDGFKYNFSAIEVDWKREVTASLETDLGFSAKNARPKELIWEGNALRRCDPYNTFFDSRVPLAEISRKGEFAGYTELMSRIQLKSYIETLPNVITDNIKAAFESGETSFESFYIPEVNPEALLNRNTRATMDWMSWASLANKNSGLKFAYKNLYEVTTLYARILPSDFGLRVPARNTPQVWKFVLVNNQVILYAERQTNAHGMLPMLFAQPLEDGLTYQTKSLASNVKSIQEVSSALLNSVLASRRRAISDRVLYDPSRIAEHQINSDSPSAKIPVRPAAYGKSVGEAVFPFPFRDDQASISLQEVQSLQGFANLISGQNPARQGQFVKGNKTLKEYSDVMSHANGRDQLTAMTYETQFFTPLKEILKINVLQYQGGTSLYNRDKQQAVKIDPLALRKAVLNFKLSDGLVPAEKLLHGEAWTVAMQVIGSSPQINSGFNLAPMFSYLMKSQGADLRPFEKSQQQLAYEQALQAWTAAAQGGQQVGPQPKPADYGYQISEGAAPVPTQPAEVATRVNNITNNITNSEQA